MSYNIDTVQVLTLDAWMAEVDRDRLAVELKDELPERCFLTEEDAFGPNESGTRKLLMFSWSGVWSGNSMGNGTFQRVAACLHGRIEAVLIWEGGDSISGLRVVDGKVSNPAVVHALEAEES